MEEVFEKRSNLVMPTHYVELDSEEMSYVEGGANFWSWVSAVCVFTGVVVNAIWNPEPASKIGLTVKGLELIGAFTGIYALIND